MEEVPTFRRLRDIASRINASADLDQTLARMLEAVCLDRPWDSASLMSVDPTRAIVRVMARHPPGRDDDLQDDWRLSESPAAPALARNEAIIIPDATVSDGFPGYQRESRQRGYRTVVVLPMNYRDPDGRLTVLSIWSFSTVDVTEGELAYLQLLVDLGAIAMRKSRSIAEEQRFSTRLQAALSSHGALLRQALTDGSMTDTLSLVEVMLGCAAAVVDLGSDQIVAGRSPRPGAITHHGWRIALNGAAGRKLFVAVSRAAAAIGQAPLAVTIEAPSGPFRVEAALHPLHIDGQIVGALVLFTEDQDTSDLDHLLLESARFGLSVQLMRSHLRLQLEGRTTEDVLADLLIGKHDPADLVRRADRLDLDLGRPMSLIAIDPALAGDADVAHLRLVHDRIASIARSENAHWTVLPDDGFLAILSPVAARGEANLSRLAARLLSEIEHIVGRCPIVVLGPVGATPAEHALAWQTCEHALRFAARFGRRGILSSTEFGMLPTLLSASDPAAITDLVRGRLGPMLAHDAANGTAYAQTLSAYLDGGCRTTLAAERLGLHVTSLRYRLNQIKRLFGLRIDTPEHRFELQLALRLSGAVKDGQP